MQRTMKSTVCGGDLGVCRPVARNFEKSIAVRTALNGALMFAGLQPVLIAGGQHVLGRLLQRDDRAVIALNPVEIR